MQLIVETETTIDIDRKMTTIEEIQTNKVDNFENHDLNKKCNGNKITEVNTNTDDKENKQVISDIPQAVENNEVELSNVDLSKVIGDNNSSNAQIEESQKKCSDIVMNGLAEEENENLRLILEDDELEDDIICLREEPNDIIAEPSNEEKNLDCENKESLSTNEKHLEESLTNEKEVIDIALEPEEVSTACEGSEQEHSLNNDKDILDVTQEPENVTTACEETKQSTTTEKHVEKAEDSSQSKKTADFQGKELDSNKPSDKEEPITCGKEISSSDKQDEPESKKITKEKDLIEVTDASDKSEKVIVPGVDEPIQNGKENVSGVDESKQNNKNDCNKSNETPIQNKEDLNNLKEENNKIIFEQNSKESQNKPNSCPVASAKDTKSSGNIEVKDVAKEAVDSPIDLRDDIMDIDEILGENKAADTPIVLKDDMDVEEVIKETTSDKEVTSKVKETTPVSSTPVNKNVDKPIVCKLSNTLDILSDDDEEPPEPEAPKVDLPKETDGKNKQCIDLEDDDDIMVIDEDSSKTDKTTPEADIETANKPIVNDDSKPAEETIKESTDSTDKPDNKDSTPPPVLAGSDPTPEPIDINDKVAETTIVEAAPKPPLVPENFLKTAKMKLSDMTREDLEEFCVLKIVESIIDRSSLSDIKNKLKTLSQGLEEYRKKVTMLTKQNRDLQVVLKSVQEEQKKSSGSTPITPLKITRSVGMQVLMEKTVTRKKVTQQTPNNNKNPNTPQNRSTTPQGPRVQRPQSQNIPVPRLVPATPGLKTQNTAQASQMNTPIKNANSPNGVVKNSSPVNKPEKRPHNKMASSSVTVDLTDDEPPSKMPGGPKNSPTPPVRLVPPQNLMAPQRQAFGSAVNSPRKVYIPISGPQDQALRPGQTIVLKTVPATSIRARCPPPQVSRVDAANNARVNRTASRHPAPLPFAMKQYQPPNWKALPPAPDLKLSKVENGIVISWKIEDFPEDSYEEIASYQLYAYQETSSPPNTALWKKIGDVKALPLPMACTLTQFMAGFKYYFAVRAVDIRSRLGPFSLPGSILLLNKNI